MFTPISTLLDAKTIHYKLEKDGVILSVAEVIRHWREAPEFRSFYNGLLAEAPFSAYFWECPPMTRSTVDEPFEFVLVNSPSLARVEANGRPFRAQFTRQEAVVVFPNIGGDATLVVPTPQAEDTVYTHLAQFVRHAPAGQIDAFWQQVGQTYGDYLSEKKLWLSTSGLGVYWLHVRLDSWPKYYTYRAYRK